MGQPVTRRPLIVEFIGFTGAGKSTIADKLVQSLEHRGLNAVDVKDLIRDRWRDKNRHARKANRFFFHLGYPFRNWKLCTCALKYVLGTRPIRLKEIKWIRYLFVLDWIYKEIRADKSSNGYEVAISSDGFLQIIWTLTLLKQAPSHDDLRLFLETVLEDHDVYPVIFVIDAEEAYSRVRGRHEAGSRLARLTRDEFVQRLVSNRETLEAIFQISRARSSFGSLSVHTSKKVEENLHIIIRELEAKLRPPTDEQCVERDEMHK